MRTVRHPIRPPRHEHLLAYFRALREDGLLDKDLLESLGTEKIPTNIAGHVGSLPALTLFVFLRVTEDLRELIGLTANREPFRSKVRRRGDRVRVYRDGPNVFDFTGTVCAVDEAKSLVAVSSETEWLPVEWWEVNEVTPIE